MELSEVWTKNTEWDFSGSHDLVWNEMRGYECFECGIPLPAPLGQEQPSAVGNTHRGRFIDKLNTPGQAAAKPLPALDGSMADELPKNDEN